MAINKKIEDINKRYTKPEELYRKIEEKEPPSFLEEKEEYTPPKPEEKIITIRERETLRAGEEDEITSLQRASPKIIGNLFDRVAFLKERIGELKFAVEERKAMHKEIVSEIASDISERRAMLASLSVLSEKRDFMLDITLLAKEKRKENVQFWRDLLEINTELRELLEMYAMESKIASIFREIESEGAKSFGGSGI